MKEFDGIIRGLANRHHLWRVFSDFCEMSALSIENALLKDPEKEKRYMQIIGCYEPDEVKQFPMLFAHTVTAQDLDRDFLGETFMRLELGSHWHGQFFTPIHICKMMALMTLGGADDLIKDKGFFTAMEPACGAGAMVIGLASAMKDSGLDYQKQVHVTCVDKDPTAANMAYIQLSLHHIPALVYTGDSLSLKMDSVRATPAHILGGWDKRL